MDAGRAGQMLLIEDMRSEQRWPDYAQRAAAHGVLSSLSVPLPFQGATIGALNTYAGRPQFMDDHDVELADEVAAWVAVAVGNAEAAARSIDDLGHLRIAMMSRAYIEQAKGILMERTQDQRRRGVHDPHPRLTTNQHQAARRGRRARQDRRGAQSRIRLVLVALQGPDRHDRLAAPI
jgi:GAF domain-containing protein